MMKIRRLNLLTLKTSCFVLASGLPAALANKKRNPSRRPNGVTPRPISACLATRLARLFAAALGISAPHHRWSARFAQPVTSSTIRG